MRTWLVKFWVNSKVLTEQTVNAPDINKAKALIQAQYAGSKISFVWVKPV